MRLGKASARELLEAVTSEELTEWQAFFRLEQKGREPEDEYEKVESDLRSIFGRPG